jgi:hypothetical protein
MVGRIHKLQKGRLVSRKRKKAQALPWQAWWWMGVI